MKSDAPPAPAAAPRADAVDFSVYRTLFEGTGDSIFLMRGEQFVDCNPATLAMFGCTRAQIIGQPPYRFSPQFQPDGRRSDEKALEKIGAAFDGRTQHFEWLHCRHDGTPFDAEVTLNVVQVRGEPHLLATVRDTSERKRAEAELAQSRHALEQRNESLRLINHLSTRLHGALETDEILALTVEALLGMVPAPTVLIALCHPEGEGEAVHVVACEGPTTVPDPVAVAGALHAAAISHALVLVDPEHPGWQAETEGFGALLACALRFRDRPLGTIALLYSRPHAIAEIERDAFVAIANTVASALASAEATVLAIAAKASRSISAIACGRAYSRAIVPSGRSRNRSEQARTAPKPSVSGCQPGWSGSTTTSACEIAAACKALATAVGSRIVVGPSQATTCTGSPSPSLSGWHSATSTVGAGTMPSRASTVSARISSVSSAPCRRVDRWLIRRRLSLRCSSARRDAASSASARLRSLVSRTVASRCGSPRTCTTFKVTSASKGVPSWRQCSHSKCWVRPWKAAPIFSSAFSSERRPSGWNSGEKR
jgi:PAS domain S-box-containing protein